MSTDLTIDLNHNKSDKIFRNEDQRTQSFDLSFLLFGKTGEDFLHYHWISSYLLLFFNWNHFLSEMVHKSKNFHICLNIFLSMF